LHQAGTGKELIVHRNLTPKTILVKHDNSPILTGFKLTKIPSDISVAFTGAPTGGWEVTVAPEVRLQGLGAADHRSDVYSLCACLTGLFEQREDKESQRATEILAGGLAEAPKERFILQDLEVLLSELLGESIPPPEPPPARFWTEEQVVRYCSAGIIYRKGVFAGGFFSIFSQSPAVLNQLFKLFRADSRLPYN